MKKVRNNPLLNRVAEMIEEHSSYGMFRDARFDQFNNRRLAYSAAKMLGYYPDDPYQPKFWRNHEALSRGSKTMVANIRDTLVEVGAYYLGEFDIAIEDARHIISSLKRKGYQTNPIRADRRVVGYKLTSIDGKPVRSKKAQVSCS